MADRQNRGLGLDRRRLGLESPVMNVLCAMSLWYLCDISTLLYITVTVQD